MARTNATTEGPRYAAFRYMSSVGRAVIRRRNQVRRRDVRRDRRGIYRSRRRGICRDCQGSIHRYAARRLRLVKGFPLKDAVSISTQRDRGSLSHRLRQARFSKRCGNSGRQMHLKDVDPFAFREREIEGERHRWTIDWALYMYSTHDSCVSLPNPITGAKLFLIGSNPHARFLPVCVLCVSAKTQISRLSWNVCVGSESWVPSRSDQSRPSILRGFILISRPKGWPKGTSLS